MLSPVTLKQFDRFKQRFPDAVLLPLPSGAALVTVPSVPLVTGWSKPATSVRFVVPAGYPGPALDCFWADEDLRLANGTPPQSSQIQGIPEVGQQGWWFSWHVVDAQNNWNPNHHDLITFMEIIKHRLRQPQ